MTSQLEGQDTEPPFRIVSVKFIAEAGAVGTSLFRVYFTAACVQGVRYTYTYATDELAAYTKESERLRKVCSRLGDQHQISSYRRIIRMSLPEGQDG